MTQAFAGLFSGGLTSFDRDNLIRFGAKNHSENGRTCPKSGSLVIGQLCPAYCHGANLLVQFRLVNPRRDMVASQQALRVMSFSTVLVFENMCRSLSRRIQRSASPSSQAFPTSCLSELSILPIVPQPPFEDLPRVSS